MCAHVLAPAARPVLVPTPPLAAAALGFFGDLIDGLSIATTTFGVCTSLGLGVGQLSSGMPHLININCKPEDNCVAAGGTWDITGYGTNNCLSPTSTPVSCTAGWLADTGDACTTTDNKKMSYYALISIVTLLATASVLTGDESAIKYGSSVMHAVITTMDP